MKPTFELKVGQRFTNFQVFRRVLMDKFSSNDNADYMDFDPEIEFMKPTFELKKDQRFTNFQVVIRVLIEWNIREGYELKWINNDSKRMTGTYEKRCPWRIHASIIGKTNTFQIKTLREEHHCGRDYKNKHVTSTYLSQKYQFKVRDNPTCGLVGLKGDIRRELMVDVSIPQFGQKQFEVDTPKRQVVVNLDDCTCTCGLFQLTSIPCPHAIATIQVDRKKKLVDTSGRLCPSKIICTYDPCNARLLMSWAPTQEASTKQQEPQSHSITATQEPQQQQQPQNSQEETFAIAQQAYQPASTVAQQATQVSGQQAHQAASVVAQ
ncbi:hypothetical protein ACH5RR_026243 [Cinchona calisaya]|uniref:SWIM-type domain-containing protein n=1 Tax=Cinchona calisaya TaxID=153742 RepID=A0ABD2Z2A9_9GENT